MFRDLIPQLADQFHVVAPDLPGSANPTCRRGAHSTTPLRTSQRHRPLHGSDRPERFALYVFDYGAPVGFRLAMRHPERITAIISQNGNAYVEGLSDGWNPIRAYWQDPSANRNALRGFLSPETTLWQYTHGVADEPRSRRMVFARQFLPGRPGADEIQLDLFGDYKSNVALYPTFQNYFRSTSRDSWRFGEGTTRSSCRRAPRPSSATFPKPRSILRHRSLRPGDPRDEIATTIREFLAR